MSLRLASNLLAACLCVGLGLATPGAARAESVADTLSGEVRAVFARCQSAVVKVEACDKNGPLRGTGFFIDPNGTLLTSFSVGGESRDIVISYGDIKSPARRLVADCGSGIAILQVEKVAEATPFLPMGKSSELAMATPVLTVAYPVDMPLTPNFGMVGGFDLKFLGRYFATTHIRANIPVQRGEGGAPLLNMQGEVVGVVISSLDGGASCFALPIEAAEKIHRDYVRFGAARPGRLGVMIRSAVNGSHGSTAEVESVDEGSPALAAGIKKGDIVARIGQTEIKMPEDVLNASFYLTAGESVPVTLWRDDKELNLNVDPAPRVASQRRFPGLRVAIPTGSPGDITLRPER